MVKDYQVRNLRRLLENRVTLADAAKETNMDEKTARKYQKSEKMPSEQAAEQTAKRNWRTRKDPFADVWPKVQQLLETDPRLRAFALFEWLQDEYPDRFPDSQKRTFERRVRQWRSEEGPAQEVMFTQVHHPGDLACSDFTHMNALRVTIAKQPFDHLLYHFTLTYSNWEFFSVCFSESFESVSRGLQDAFWTLGGVPKRHRTDSLTAAVNNLSHARDFRKRFRELNDHYRVEPQRINVRKAHENGDVESSHGHLKTVVEQALLLRGSRNFETREDYDQFLRQLMDKRNAKRKERFAQELQQLKELPPGRLDHRLRLREIGVRKSSTIQIKRNTYSVPSRLIGHSVDVVIDAELIEVWHAGKLVQTMPRVIGAGKHTINYRHVIDSLVRKPGAFENYKYREEMFPTSHFRMAYDWLCRERSSRAADREYLKILQLAARDSQDVVQDVLRLALADNAPISLDGVRQAIERHQQAPPATEVHVEPPDLKAFDSLLQHLDTEVHFHERAIIPQRPQQQTDGQTNGQTDGQTDGQASGPQQDRGEASGASASDPPTNRTVSGASVAEVSGALRETGAAGERRVTTSPALSGGTDSVGMSSAQGEPDCAPSATVEAAFGQDVGQLRLEPPSTGGVSPIGKSSGGSVPGPSREPSAVREAGFGQTSTNAIPLL